MQLFRYSLSYFQKKQLQRSSIYLLIGLLCCPIFAQVILPPDPNIQVPQKQIAPLPSPSSSPFILPPAAPPGSIQNQGAPQPPLSEILGEANLAAPKGIKRLPPLWPYYLSATALAFIVFCALLFWISRRNRKAKPIPIIPADVRALNGLEALIPLIKEAKAREFSYQASEIIRGYIEDRFGVRARNRTTREFLDMSLKEDPTISEKHQGSLKQFLNYCDLAKFAKQMLSPEQLNQMYSSASQFIKETRPSIMAVSANPETTEQKEVEVS